ncbi:MAG TPA: hypothetical protein VFX15_03270 [Actinomycetes bacterium]|nr:hypothetical protein [Actinomycetes bacterium]
MMTFTFVDKIGNNPPIGPFTVPGELQLTRVDLRSVDAGWIESLDPNFYLGKFILVSEGASLAFLERESSEWVPLIGLNNGVTYSDIVLGVTAEEVN